MRERRLDRGLDRAAHQGRRQRQGQHPDRPLPPAGAAAQRQQRHADHHQCEAGELARARPLAEEQHRAQHGEQRRDVADRRRDRGPSASLERTDRIDTSDRENQPDAGEDQRCLEFELAEIDEDQRKQPGRDRRAADAVDRRAPRRHGAQPVLDEDLRQGETDAAASAKRAAALMGICYSRRLPNRGLNMDTLTYWNGTWHEGNPAILGPRDHAFWLGSMVFDGGRAFEGCGPDLDLHAERVVRSAKALGLKPTKTAKEILDADARGRAPLRAQGRALRAADVLGDQGRRRARSRSIRESTQFLLCVYHSPMRAGTPLTLGLCRTIRRPTPESAPTMAKASLPLSQLLARRRRDAGARLQQRRRARLGGQRGRDLQLQHLPRQGRRRGDAGAQRQLPRRHHPQPHRQPCCAMPASGSTSAR